jgi:hypothetical protein
MKFKKGDRVLMLKHADWKSDIVGTIAGFGGLRRLYDGTIDVVYGMDFDELHTDLTDEANKEYVEYCGCTVLEQYLIPFEVKR